MKKRLKSLVAFALATTMVFPLMGCSEKKSSSDKFPSKDINITVPFGVGGSADTSMRLVSQYLEKEVGKNVVITNRTGAGGVIATTEYLAKPSESHNLLMGGIGMFTIAPLFNKNIKFTLEDFKPVAGIVSDEFIIYANPKKSGIKSFDDLIEYSKKNEVIFGSNAPGGTTHLLQASLYKMAGIKAKNVPGESSFVDITNLLGGHVTVAVGNPSTGAAHVKEGSLVPIAVFSEKPYTNFEGVEVPTVKSLGYDIVFESLNFLMGRADMKDEEAEILANKISKVYDNEEFKAQAAKSNYVPNRYNGKELTEKIQSSIELSKKLYNVIYEK